MKATQLLEKITFAGILLVCLSTMPMLTTNQANAVELGDQEIGIDFNFTYATEYIWHGYYVYDNAGAFQPSIKVDWNGFYASIWGSWADESGFVKEDELDYIVGWNKTLWEDQRYALGINTCWTYFDLYKDGSTIDMQEFALNLSLPKVLPLGPSYLVPVYSIYYECDAFKANRALKDGFFHEIGLNYDIPIPALIPDQKEQAISLGWLISYEDDVYTGVKDGWNFTTVSASTTFRWNNFYLTPTIKYQWSLEDTMNPDDELYGLISVGYKF